MSIHRSSRSSMMSSASSSLDSCLKYQMVEVEACGLHGGQVGCLSMVSDWLWRAVCCQREVCGPRIRFPENLFVSVVHDRDVVVAVLKNSSLVTGAERVKPW
ncbi:unnamed protein product [Macrosiphum euphorbiae]|uniref:Uncharacterized protein n=1 Tax=Macrosiphum euphorbiae TaxID=13131 RepID=A0AAV0VTS7_9HEMI|nr:unnamed protein product [Macrosiphum euphorbiae]